MESEILTGRKINEAKNNTTDEAVEEILKAAQEQINRDMGEKSAHKKEELKGREVVAGKSDGGASQERIRKEQVEKAKREQERRALQARAEQERLSREKAEQERRARQQAEEQRKAREQAERERRARQQAEEQRKAKEKAEQERLEKEHIEKEKQRQKLEREKAEQERLEKEKTEQEKIKREQEARAAQEKAERDKFVKEKAEKERVGKELAAYDKTADDKDQGVIRIDDTIKKELPDIKVQGNTQRIDIQVGQTVADMAAKEKSPAKEIAAAMEMADVEDVIVETNVPTPIRRKDGITVGDVIGGFFEFVWTLFKLAVVISIATAIFGFFLSREMLIRGRNGNLKSLDSMVASQTVSGTKDAEKAAASDWRLSSKPKKLTMESDDGYILVAREVVINKDSNNWAVILHEYNGSMENVYDIAKHYTDKGYNVLLPDLRASGESEGSFIGMGWLDRLDVINWVDVILDDNPDANIVIHGVDMGADTGLMISGEPIKSNIKAIVADGAYTSAWDVMKKEFKVRHEKWPVFPVMEMINPVAKVWGGYTLREASAVNQVAKTSVPILLIQGGNDTYVTNEMAEKLNAAVASSHKLVTIPSATHGDCRYADPDTYYKEVFDFVELHTR